MPRDGGASRGIRALARVNRSSLCRARVRLGEDVLEIAFRRMAGPLDTRGTPGARSRSPRSLTLEGTRSALPDPTSNGDTFDGPCTNGGGLSRLPRTRAAALARIGTHGVPDARLGGYRNGERTPAHPPAGSSGPGDPAIADRVSCPHPFPSDRPPQARPPLPHADRAGRGCAPASPGRAQPVLSGPAQESEPLACAEDPSRRRHDPVRHEAPSRPRSRSAPAGPEGRQSGDGVSRESREGPQAGRGRSRLAGRAPSNRTGPPSPPRRTCRTLLTGPYLTP
ncbi:hypothetical protein GCM10010363_73860 [Streptomyces omiyaensis]|nr:hypothetical protein GCM10010363_73860 [Streptomyces omiyaensis]